MKELAVGAGCRLLTGGGWNQAGYFPMRYMRSPASFFADSIFTPCFLLAVGMKPRTL
jgi:hypothetical protein